LLAHPHLPGRETYETDEASAGRANNANQKQREPRQGLSASSKNPHVGPGIEVLLNRQKVNMFVSATIPKLGAIGVLLPAHAAQQFPVGGTEPDQIAPAAMIGPDDQFSRRQLSESALDIDRAKPRAVPPDRDDFIIAKLRNSFDGILQTRREITASLPVDVKPRSDLFLRRGEKMNIGVRQNFGANGSDIKEWMRRLRERTARQIDVDFVGEYENSASGHAFGYENGRARHKPFSLRKRRVCNPQSNLP
jgi:hypothetical protein